ncbi:MAG: L-asparaginase, partial [Bacteroidetes bacterium 38_7]
IRGKGKPKFYKSLCTDIFLLKLIPGIDPGILDHLCSKYTAIIIGSYGSGGIPIEGKRNFLSKIEELTAKGKIIVITTQVLLEGSDLTLYEVGQKALKNPVIPAYDMSTEAIVTKLMWVLGRTGDRKKVRKIFLTPINGDLVIDKEQQ